MPRTKNSKGLTKAQMKQVKKIAASVVDDEIEDKEVVAIVENIQLFHNLPQITSALLGTGINQGVKDGGQAQAPTGTRIGDQISLKNVNIRFWLSNKLDRPNVMYKGVLFWYESSLTGSLTNALIYKSQTNKILDRYNDKQIKVVDTFLVKPQAMFLNGTEKFEHSYLATLNKSYKNKKIQFDNNGSKTKGWDLAFALVCYDAYGTLQTDNIASFAYNLQMVYQDA